jgi:tRNA(Ile)-lysidine synthase
MNMIFDEISQVLNDKCLLTIGQPICVGVSGGPDSICLLGLLISLKYPIIIGHFNHQLRHEADNEENKIKKFAKAKGIPVFVGKGDVSGYAEEKCLSIEDAARTLRYKFLFNVAKSQNAQAVAVGHTAEDQVETFFLHLIRGSGLDGLCGMRFRTLPNAWSNNIPLVRPLLSLWRDEIMENVTQHNLPYFTDKTNSDTYYKRNWVRHELLPLLKSINPNIKENIWQTTAIIQSEKDALEVYVNQSWSECLIEQSPGFIKLKRAHLVSLPIGLQSQLLRKAINMIKTGTHTIDYATINRIRICLNGGRNSSGCDVINGIRFLAEGDVSWFYLVEYKPRDSSAPQMDRSCLVQLEIPGKAELGEGWILTSKIYAGSNVERSRIINNPDLFKVWIDGEIVEQHLTIRTRHTGDRIRPLGMKRHTMKVSDLMINKKMPARLREAWPLVCYGEDIIWVPGYLLADTFKVTEKTKTLILLEIQRENIETNLPSKPS